MFLAPVYPGCMERAYKGQIAMISWLTGFAEFRIRATPDIQPGVHQLSTTRRPRSIHESGWNGRRWVYVQELYMDGWSSSYIFHLLGHHWCYSYSQALHHVMNKGFAARPPHYKTILEVDRMIRELDTPDHLRPEPVQDHGVSTKLVVRRWIVLSNTEWSASTSEPSAGRDWP